MGPGIMSIESDMALAPQWGQNSSTSEILSPPPAQLEAF